MKVVFVLALLVFMSESKEDKLFLWFNGHHDGHKCLDYLASFEVTGISLTGCAKQCESDLYCRSFFYTETSRTCQGSVWTLSSRFYVQLPENVGSRYFYETDGWHHFNGSRYILIKAGGYMDDEEETCNSFGGHIVNIGSKEENDFIGTIVEDYPDIYSVRIGLTDRQTEGVWKWIDDGSTPVFTAWDPRWPNDEHRDSAAINHRKLWISLTITDTDPCICEVEL